MKLIKSAVAVLLTLALAGCMKPVGINQRAIVQGIGIDKHGGGYRLTLQIFEPTSEKPAGSLIVQADGETISDALQKAQTQNGRTMFYGQNKMLVLGEAAAKNDINAIIGFFNANHQSRPNMDVLVTRGKAADVIQSRPQEGEQALLSIRNVLESSESGGQVLRGSVMSIVASLENGYSGFCTPVVQMSGQGEQKTVELSGAAVYRQGRLVGALTQAQTRGALWVRGEVSKTRLVVEDLHIGKVSLAVTDAHTKITPSIRSGMPHFQIDCTVSSHINENVVIKNGVSLPQRVGALKEQQARLVQDEIESALDACMGEYGVDIFGFANLLAQREPEWFAQNKSRYGDILPGFTYEVRVESRISRYGLQS